MKSRRLVAVLALLAALVGAFVWWNNRPLQPQPGPTAAPPSSSAPAPAQAAVPATADADRPDARTTVDTDPNAPSFTVRGHVLAAPRHPIGGAEVVAHAGKPDDRGGFLTMIGATHAGGPGPEDVPIRAGGEVLARAAVAADGTFTLTARSPHLRLALEHDLYGLALPEIVHVSPTTRSAEVVLAPYLGGCLRGRLLGGDARGIRGIRLSARPDPLAVLRDPKGFLGSIARSASPPVQPAADGTFSFRAVTPGAWLNLFAAGDEFSGRTTQPALEPGETRDVALPIARALDLEVRVVDGQDRPVADVHVAARPDDDGGPDAMARELGAARGTTAADGTLRLRGLCAGNWQLRANAPGFLQATATAAVPADGPALLHISRGASIRGTVVDHQDAPVAGAHVATMPSLEVPMLGDLSAQMGLDVLAAEAQDGVPTDAQGTFELTGVDDGARVTVIAVHPDHAVGIARGVTSGTGDVRIVLPPAHTLTVRVVADEDGTPLHAFTVELRTTMFAMLERAVRTVSVADAADGTARLEGLPGGSFTLAAHAEDRSEATAAVSLEATATDAPATHELRLPRAASLSGRVVDEHGDGIGGALVQRSRGGIRDNPVLAMMQGGEDTVRCNRRGEFRLGGVAPGRLQLAATADGFAGAKSARIEVGVGQAVADVVITLDHGGSIDGVLRTMRGDQADEFSVIVQNEATQKTAPCRPGADGHFRADNLEPGRYQVQAMHPSAMRLMQHAGEVDPTRGFDMKGIIASISESTVSQRCVVRSGEATAVELDASDLGTGTRLSLRVTIGGEPLQNGIVEAMMVDDGRLRIGFLDGGEATFAALRPGRVRVQVRTGMTMAPVGEPRFVDVPMGIDHHRATLELPGGELAGRVVDADGRPLGSVLVRLLRSGGADDEVFGTAITDGGGAFAFRALQPDSYGLVAADALLQRTAEGAASRVDAIRLGDGERRTDIVLHAQPAAGAAVTVTGSDGAPLPGAMLLAVDPDGRPLGNFALAVTGSDGKAHLGGLPQGALRIAGRATGFAPDVSAVLAAEPGRSLDVTLALPRGTRVAVEARARDGTPLAGATIRARCNGGPWLPSMLLLENNGAGGRFELGRLAPGAWEFRIEHPASGTFTIARTIGDGAAVTILATPP